MPATGRSTNTASEVLTDILRSIATCKTMPDAPLDLLVNLETQVLGYLRDPMAQAGAQMGPQQAPSMPPMPGGGPGGMPPGGPGGAMPAMPPMPSDMAPPPGGVPGLRAQPPGPSPDEMSRLLAGG